MAPIQKRLRNAIGLLKDQTSISIAKVASAGAPDLEVAIVKATSHDEVPIEEKHVQQVLHLTSYSRAYVNACVCNIARRLSKTCNWIVAIKALILAHRLLRDGDAAFEKELMLSRRRAFVHAYGLYLDDRLDCSSVGSLASRAKPPRSSLYKGGKYEFSDGMHHNDSDESLYHEAEKKRAQTERSKLVKDMNHDELLETIPIFQCLLERVLGCRPTGPAKVNRLIHIALYAVIRESFVLYEDLREGLAILLDAFFNMESRDCSRAFKIYETAAKQMEALTPFYSFCKALGVCKTVEYPNVELISKELLHDMKDFLHSGRRSSPEPKPLTPQDEEAIYEVNGMKALPAPPLEDPPPAAASSAVDFAQSTLNSGSNGSSDLLNINEPTMSSEERGDMLTLALFSGTQNKVESKWEAFPEQGKRAASWELALIESESDISKPNDNTLAGGFDHLLLDSLYEQGANRRNMLLGMGPAGSASSVAVPGHPQSNFLALPAPPVATSALFEDPFAASESVPCPAYVQMSDIRQKQQLLVQEQLQWLQYQQGGMQGYVGLVKYPNNPFATPFQQTAYPVSYYGSNPFHH